MATHPSITRRVAALGAVLDEMLGDGIGLRGGDRSVVDEFLEASRDSFPARRSVASRRRLDVRGCRRSAAPALRVRPVVVRRTGRPGHTEHQTGDGSTDQADGQAEGETLA